MARLGLRYLPRLYQRGLGASLLSQTSIQRAPSLQFGTSSLLRRQRNVNQKEGVIEVGDIAFLERVYTKENMAAFAEISGDFNPLHLDEEYAKTTKFGKPIVYGALQFGLLSGVMGSYLPGTGGILLNYTLRHPAPLYVGERMKAEIEVLEKLPGRRLKVKMTCTEISSGKVVATGEVMCIASKSRFG